MNTLAVYYSKSGTTQKVAEAVAAKTGCDLDAIAYDEDAKTVQTSKNPGDYDRIVLLSPVWAFSLAEPMKLYVKQNASGIKTYSLIVTCGMLGLRGCVRACKSLLGKAPEQARKFRSKQVKQGDFTI
jgi:flavodoxin